MDRSGSGAAAELEQELFRALAAGVPPAPLFILGSPRTGSTIVYQICAERFRLPFIANLTNDQFPLTPILGLAIQKSVPVAITYESQFGKTEGAFQPSEGSAVLTNWFGGGHPSQLVSATIRPGKEEHLRVTLTAAEGLFGLPLVIKNAWNCFRVASLASLLPGARFLWVRRDIARAATSDLEARYVTKGTAQIWNSATPADYEALKERPPVEQVVENQYAFNRTVGEDLATHADGRWREIWYEDLLAAPDMSLRTVGELLGMTPQGHAPVLARRTGPRPLGNDEAAAIEAYVIAQGERLAAYRRAEEG